MSGERSNIEFTPDSITIDQANHLLVGKTIAAAEFEDTVAKWPQGAWLTLTFTDGTSIQIASWGYDADGFNVEFREPGD